MTAFVGPHDPRTTANLTLAQRLKRDVCQPPDRGDDNWLCFAGTSESLDSLHDLIYPLQSSKRTTGSIVLADIYKDVPE